MHCSRGLSKRVFALLGEAARTSGFQSTLDDRISSDVFNMSTCVGDRGQFLHFEQNADKSLHCFRGLSKRVFALVGKAVKGNGFHVTALLIEFSSIFEPANVDIWPLIGRANRSGARNRCTASQIRFQRSFN